MTSDGSVACEEARAASASAASSLPNVAAKVCGSGDAATAVFVRVRVRACAWDACDSQIVIGGILLWLACASKRSHTHNQRRKVNEERRRGGRRGGMGGRRRGRERVAQRLRDAPDTIASMSPASLLVMSCTVLTISGAVIVNLRDDDMAREITSWCRPDLLTAHKTRRMLGSNRALYCEQ